MLCCVAHEKPTKFYATFNTSTEFKYEMQLPGTVSTVEGTAQMLPGVDAELASILDRKTHKRVSSDRSNPMTRDNQFHLQPAVGSASGITTTARQSAINALVLV